MTFTPRRAAALALLVLLPLISACHTIEGIGKDITAVGRGMQDATK
ncbi:MAG: entericidin [Asticcacaulis sp.]